ncbi:MAG: hypothetical protein KI785_04995 [Devosiaceae bacterium]|nr:hypothetical protein [Devosiaceae bacterium MH13]
MVVGLHLTGFNAIDALRDARLSDAPEAGLVSGAGVLLMGLGGVVAATCALKTCDVPLGAVGLFCCLFALDDGLLIHELLGDWEVAVFGLYGLLAALILLLFRAEGWLYPWPVLVAIAAFAFSVSIDFVWSEIVHFTQLTGEIERIALALGIVIEDVPKFAGICVLSSFAIGEAVSNLWQGEGASAV